jgi:hypothetical protein
VTDESGGLSACAHSGCGSAAQCAEPNQGQVRTLGRTVSEMKPRRADPARRYLPGSPFNVPVTVEPAESYEPRDLVSHDKYGLGSVLDVEGQAAVVVDFRTHRRRITLPCARLVKL